MGTTCGVLSEHGIERIVHYAPMHYLPFIARSRALKSKSALRQEGFTDTHFRSTSRRQDSLRGFSWAVHLSTLSSPPILRAKLRAGFPHFEVAVPSRAVEAVGFDLCRFNIAKARYFRGAKRAPEESGTNGRYRDGMSLPIARTSEEQRSMLGAWGGGAFMLEVLVNHMLPLDDGCQLRFFSSEDIRRAECVLTKVGADFTVRRASGLEYEPSSEYVRLCDEALQRALAEPTWKGSGIEFDRI
jgi:hypothetical protein